MRVKNYKRDLAIAVVSWFLMLIAGLIIGEISANKYLVIVGSPTLSACAFYVLFIACINTEKREVKKRVNSMQIADKSILGSQSREKRIRWSLGCCGAILFGSGALAGVSGPPPKIALMHFLYFSGLSLMFLALFYSLTHFQNLYCKLLEMRINGETTREE